MVLIDDYNQNTSEDGGQGANSADDRRQRAEIERQITIADSDLKKTLREIEDLELQRRKFKKEEERLRIDEDALDKDIKKLYNDKLLLEGNIQQLKKRLKAL